jgi:hypothetical protein
MMKNDDGREKLLVKLQASTFERHATAISDEVTGYGEH